MNKIKALLKENIVADSNDYFIYISNSGRPLIWNSGGDIDELLTRISLARPEPASYYDDKRFIAPYIKELKYDQERREVHFNFLFSESFLNHSSEKFIQVCINDLNDDSYFKSGKVVVYSYSTAEKPNYQEYDKHYFDMNNVIYKKL